LGRGGGGGGVVLETSSGHTIRKSGVD